MTHWEIQVFLRFSGRIGAIWELGQPMTYIAYFIVSLGLIHKHNMTHGISAYIGHIPGSSRELNATLNGLR